MSSVNSMNDIAVALGLSRTTVSLSLSGKAGRYKIAPETVERIKLFAEKHGFVPNVMAQSIGGARKRTVGFLVGVDYFSSKNHAMMSHAIGEFSKCGWGYHMSHFTKKDFAEAFVRMKGLGVAAVLALGSLTFTREIREKMSPYTTGLPLYLIDYPFSGEDEAAPENVHRIGIERETAYVNAFTKLFEMGHKSILVDDHSVKLTAYAKVLSSLSKNFDESFVLSHPSGYYISSFERGRALLAEVMSKLKLNKEITAISLHDDELAAGLVTALLDAGVSVPGDLSVVGFDNIDASAHFRIPLSTIEVPVRKMVDVAVSAVCGGETLKGEGDVVMDGRLILRDSVRDYRVFSN